MTFRPQFTPRIDLGHVMQAGMMLIAVGGGLGTVFFTLQSQITAQASLYAGLQQQVMQQGASIRQLQDDQRRVAESLTATLSKLGDQLSDLRVLVAKEGRSGR